MAEISETLSLPLAAGKMRQLLAWLTQLHACQPKRWNLTDFSDRQLRDIGVTRCELQRERHRWR